VNFIAVVLDDASTAKQMAESRGWNHLANLWVNEAVNSDVVEKFFWSGIYSAHSIA